MLLQSNDKKYKLKAIWDTRIILKKLLESYQVYTIWSLKKDIKNPKI